MILYLRNEIEHVWNNGYPTTKSFVAYYGDEKATILKCKNSWPSKPTRRNKYTFYNCSRYEIVWLPDLKS